MSLFSRLEERMRARDSQDDSKEKEKSSKSDNQSGGLFGLIQLKPTDGESSVPPPAFPDEAGGVAARSVPSLEEARAELDRARAHTAEQPSGLFRRNTQGGADVDQLQRSPTAPASDGTTTFGAVSLPPRVQEDAAPAPAPFDAPARETEADALIKDFAVEKPFRVPSLSQFAEGENAPQQNVETRAQPAANVTESRDQHESHEEQVVFAPIPVDDRESSDVDQAPVVTAHDVAPTFETVRAAETQTGAPNVMSPSADEMEASFSARGEERANPAPRPSSSANLTPFHRLMAARATQAGPPISRPRNDRSMPAATPPARPVTEETKVAEVAPETREFPEM